MKITPEILNEMIEKSRPKRKTVKDFEEHIKKHLKEQGYVKESIRELRFEKEEMPNWCKKLIQGTLTDVDVDMLYIEEE